MDHQMVDGSPFIACGRIASDIEELVLPTFDFRAFPSFRYCEAMAGPAEPGAFRGLGGNSRRFSRCSLRGVVEFAITVAYLNLASLLYTPLCGD